MIQLIIVTHGRFGIELVHSAELIVGKQTGIEALALEEHDNLTDFGDGFYSIISRITSQGDDVLVMTDLFGGSPSNMVLANLKRASYRCVTGVNLPMLLEAITRRMNNSIGLDNLADICVDAGKNGVLSLSMDSFK